MGNKVNVINGAKGELFFEGEKIGELDSISVGMSMDEIAKNSGLLRLPSSDEVRQMSMQFGMTEIVNDFLKRFILPKEPTRLEKLCHAKYLTNRYHSNVRD